MKRTIRKVGDIYKENGVTFKVIGTDAAGRYVLTRTTEEAVESEEVETTETEEAVVEQPKPKRGRK